MNRDNLPAAMSPGTSTHPALPQRDPDPAPVGRKSEAGLGALKRNRHTFLVGQLHPAKATNKSAAGADSVVGAGKVLQFAQVRNASCQSHGRSTGRKAEAQTGGPEWIV